MILKKSSASLRVTIAALSANLPYLKSTSEAMDQALYQDDLCIRSPKHSFCCASALTLAGDHHLHLGE